MKKIALLAIVAGSMSLASCKKDYKCTCSDSGAYASSTTFTIHDTKSKASDLCKSYMPLWETCAIA